MTHVRNRSLFRFVSLLLVTAMVTPLTILALPVPANAQLTEILNIAIADFINKSGVLGDALARMASGAVYIELNKSRRFNVTTDSAMRTVMQDLGIKSPLSSSDLLRLGAELEVDAMLEGEIKSVVTSKEPPRVSVTLVLRMVDVASGELMNGAIVTGSSSPRVGYTGDLDTLTTEAINDAAYLAVKTMVDYIIPEATVQNTIGANQVLLNKGSREGLRNGMRMIVLRDKQGGGREVVGRIVVRQTNPNDSIATVINAPKGVKPEDKVRAIYEMPGYKSPMEVRTEAATSPATYQSKGGSKKFILGLLAALGLGMMFQSGSGGVSAGTAIAEAGVPPDIAVPSPGVRVSFNPDKLSGGKNVIQYKLWRDGQVVATVSGVGIGDGKMYDTTAVPSGSYVTPDPQNPGSLITTAINAPALTLGDQHRYAVTAVYQVQQPGESSFRYVETPKSNTGPATPLARIPATDLSATTKGQADVDLRKVDFNWRSIRGANEYIVEATTQSDPNFLTPRYRSAPKRTSQFSSGEVVVIENQNIASLFSDVPEGGLILWRVGAKSISDNPGPVVSPVMRYIYSEHASIVVRETPPPPPN